MKKMTTALFGYDPENEQSSAAAAYRPIEIEFQMAQLNVEMTLPHHQGGEPQSCIVMIEWQVGVGWIMRLYDANNDEPQIKYVVDDKTGEGRLESL